MPRKPGRRPVGLERCGDESPLVSRANAGEAVFGADVKGVIAGTFGPGALTVGPGIVTLPDAGVMVVCAADGIAQTASTTKPFRLEDKVSEKVEEEIKACSPT